MKTLDAPQIFRCHRLVIACAALSVFGSPIRAHEPAPTSTTGGDRAAFAEACLAYESAMEAAERGESEVARERFRAAAARFEALAHESWYVGAWSNAGLAHASAGDPGRAVLAYRRAATIEPWSRDVRRGLAHARALVRVEAPAGTVWSAREFVRGLALRFPERGAWLAGAALYVGGGVIMAAALFHRARSASVTGTPGGPASTAPGPVRRLIRLGLACLALGGLGVAIAMAARLAVSSEDAVVVADRVTARQGPSDLLHAPAFDEPLAAGVEVRVLESRRGWLRVRLRDGRECWTPARAVERVLPSTAHEPDASSPGGVGGV